METHWRRSAIQSLLDLDQWRWSIDLPPIADYLKSTVETYFKHQDLSVYIPGHQVLIRHMPVDLRMVLVSVGKSDPYKTFYRITGNHIEVFLIRHPHQKPLL